MRGSSGLAQRLLRLERAAQHSQARANWRTCVYASASERSLRAVARPMAVRAWLRCLGCPGRRNRIARLMRLERIFARQRSKYRAATTDSRHGGPIAPNRLRNLVVRRPNQVWVTDATCVLTAQGWLYLVAVLDVFYPSSDRLGHEPAPRRRTGHGRFAHGSCSTSPRPRLSSSTPIAALSSPAPLIAKSWLNTAWSLP